MADEEQRPAARPVPCNGVLHRAPARVRVLVEGHDVEKTGMSVDEMVSKEGKNSDGYSRTPLQSAVRERTVGDCPIPRQDLH